MRKNMILTTAVLVLCLGTAGVIHASSTRAATWPVTSFVTERSVLARYYQDFVARRPALSATTQMHQFCDLLMSSDLLSDRLSQLGGNPSDMHGILMELGSYEFDPRAKMGKEDKTHIRSLMLGLDMQLEIVEQSLSAGTRGEFRREVLADIPPLNRMG